MHLLVRGAGLALAASFVVFPASSSFATTIATFNDPSPGSPPLFTINNTAMTIEGVWDSPGLTLETISGTFFNVIFLLPQISFDATFESGPGFAEFRTEGGTLLLRIDFDSAQLNNPISFTGTEFLGLHEVSFSGPVVDSPGIVDGSESFGFGFANLTPTQTGYTATAAFTSSGQLIPEPSSLVGLIVASVLAIRRRHR